MPKYTWVGSSNGVVAKELKCNIRGTKFEFPSRYYVPFWTNHHHHVTLSISTDISDPLSTNPYCPLLPAGPQGYIPYRNRVAACRFELDVLPLLVHVKGSTGVHHL